MNTCCSGLCCGGICCDSGQQCLDNKTCCDNANVCGSACLSCDSTQCLTCDSQQQLRYDVFVGSNLQQWHLLYRRHGHLHQRLRLLLEQLRRDDREVRSLYPERRRRLRYQQRLLLGAGLRHHDVHLRRLYSDQRFMHKRQRLLFRALLQRDLRLFRGRCFVHD